MEASVEMLALLSSVLRRQQFINHSTSTPTLALDLAQVSMGRALLWNMMVSIYPSPSLQFLRQEFALRPYYSYSSKKSC